MKFVINYDFPGQIEDYVHRIGRTARGKDKEGTSYTFFTQENGKVSYKTNSISCFFIFTDLSVIK